MVHHEFNGTVAYTFPYSKLLGARPCGKIPTKEGWVEVGANPNFPEPTTKSENCDYGLNNIFYRSCTPKLRFKDADNNLVLDRKLLKQANNRQLYQNSMNNIPITPMNVTILAKVDMATPQFNTGAQTPFRALMNAGDPALSVNKYSGTINGLNNQLNNMYFGPDKIYANESNQVTSTRRAANQASVYSAGSMKARTTNLYGNAPSGGSEVALWSGNQKWVYDGSDYIKFKKLQAKNKNFNDISWGGDRNYASQVALARVRH